MPRIQAATRGSAPPNHVKSLIESLSSRELRALAGPETLFVTPLGNFAYSSGEYGGDNCVSPFPGGPEQWLASIGHDQCRDKGVRRVGDRLWPDWTWREASLAED